MGGLIEVGGIQVSLINVISLAWFVLAGLSTAYVLYSVDRNN